MTVCVCLFCVLVCVGVWSYGSCVECEAAACACVGHVTSTSVERVSSGIQSHTRRHRHQHLPLTLLTRRRCPRDTRTA